MSDNSPNIYRRAFVGLTFLFFMWGFMTALNDILIPYLQDAFTLTHTKAMLIQFAFFTSYFIGSVIYFIISVYKGDPINKIGYKKGIIIGLIVSGIGALLFYPAAQFHMYGFFLSALFIMGLGFTLLQIAANPYVAILGSPDSASSRLNLAQGFNSLGTTVAPILGGYLVFIFFKGSTGADAVKVPYLVFALIFMIMAFAISKTPLPRFTNPDEVKPGFQALKYPQLVFGMIAIFMYVGGEVSIGSMLISYITLPEIAGINAAEASIYVSIYWGGQMIGRFLGAISLSDTNNLKKYISMPLISIAAYVIIGLTTSFASANIYLVFLILNLLGFFIGKSLPNRTLYIFAFINIIFLAIALSTTGEIALWTIIGIGLFNSIMWSNIFTLAISGLGKYTSQGSSLLVMMILGGALLPLIMGMIADGYGVHISFIVPVASYIYIAFYGIRGYKPKNIS
ncbi:MAG: sugar MFS transporter [Bacteroidales bacterium]|jgi:MFS transporter, FHS family, L-fucose permease|nr:sugar MFS transporter [Bacteroidales bacterium]